MASRTDPSPFALIYMHMINRLLPTMLNGVLYWPFVNALNFKFVALEVRFCMCILSLYPNRVEVCVSKLFLGGGVIGVCVCIDPRPCLLVTSTTKLP